MVELAIRATFPLGTFLGHRDVGHRSPFPDTARLHAALLHAAGTGSTAVEGPEGLGPSPESVVALTWLEEHPPISLSLPRRRPVALRGSWSWRADGVRGKKGLKLQHKPQSDAIALDGSIGWTWAEQVPETVITALDALCADVSCLGEADSPVVLDLVAVTPTHRLDDSGSAFPAPGGEMVRTPQPGRVQALIEAHRATRPTRTPSSAQDKSRSDETPLLAPTPAEGLRELVYRSTDSSSAAARAPRSQVVLLHVRGAGERDRVAIAVATHRALIARLGDAPPLVTGRYSAGARQPANRLAIQFLAASLVCHKGIDSDVIALFIPCGAEAAELAAVQRAVSGLARILVSTGISLQVQGQTVHDTVGFWPAVEEGRARFWRPVPSLVPETRRQRSSGRGRQWTLADAARLSLGYVVRNDLDEEERASRWTTADAIASRGARALEVRALPDSRPERHAHRVPDGQVVFPYTALLDLGHVVDPRTLMAIGQSRHLGGGLLVPEDLLLPVAEARGLLP